MSIQLSGTTQRCGWLACVSLLFSVAWIAPSHAQSLPPLTDVQQLAAGGAHACVLTTVGAVKCWGNNEYGQLGDGTTTNRYLPVKVIGLSSGVMAISAGDQHSCALMSGGSVKCWGDNSFLELGDGTSKNRHTPVDVSGLTGVTAITAGGAHTCALIGSSDLKCWGNNYYGELGIGSTTNQSTPVSVFGGQNLIAVSAGYSNTCALTTAHTVACWGVYDRACNQLGCGFDAWETPTPIEGLGNDVVAISAGQYFTCALTTGGAVKCWGDNYYNQLGDLGDENPYPVTPFQISGLTSGVTSISAGNRHACAHLADGTARCWGDNGNGQLGDASTDRGLVPSMVAGLTTIADIAAGASFSCARMMSSGVKCWGSNSAGQLGDNNPQYRGVPVDVAGLGSGVKSISSGDYHSCAVTASGAVKCWGGNRSGQIGDGTKLERDMPVGVTGISSGASQVSAGLGQSCAVIAGGAVKCWGANQWGQLGDGSYDQRLTPVSAIGLTSGVTKVTTNLYHSCARSSSGPPHCWGKNDDRQLGDASSAYTQPMPVTVVNLAIGVSDISAGGQHSCAVVAGGKIACWGSNGHGQIGDGSGETAYLPTTLAYPDRGTIAISAGDEHSCAVSGGRVYCWGSNSDGRCGNPGGNTTFEPTVVLNLPLGATAVSAGVSHTCAIAAGGQAYCWGNNRYGQLGDNSFTNSYDPVAVSGLDSGVTQISAGGDHTCALTSGGIVKCWGFNLQGQLGIGTRNYRVPADVLEDREQIFRNGFEASGL